MKKLLVFLTICILCSAGYLVGYNTTTTTTNLELVKPATEDETVDWFDTMNDNMDLIDAIFDDVTLTEYGYLDGVTSAIQTQLNAKQPLDAGLTSIAGLTTAANKSIYTTALDTYATYNLTAFARTVLDDADEATVKATLNLEIGTDVQAYDAALANISALAYVSPSFIKLTANDTYAVRTIAEVITDLALDSDDLSDVASIAMLDENEAITGAWTITGSIAGVDNTEFGYVDGVTSDIQTQFGTKLANVSEDTTPELGGTLDHNNERATEVNTVEFNALYDNGNSGATPTINWQNGNYQKIAVSENTLFTFSNAFIGTITLQITYSGAYTAGFNAGYTILEEGGTELSFTETLNAVDILKVMYLGTANNYVVGLLADVKD